LSCDVKAKFSASLLSLPHHMILQKSFLYDHAETLLIIIHVENSCVASFFVETDTNFQDSLIKEQHLFEIEILCCCHF